MLPNPVDTKGAILQILGDRSSVASRAFAVLLELALKEIHHKMETAEGPELLRQQGASQLIRSWVATFERGLQKAQYGSFDGHYQ